MSVKLSKILERFADRIEAQTDAIALDVAGPLQERPDHLQHQGFAIYATSTEVLDRRHGDVDVYVRDRVIVDLGHRIKPKAQRASVCSAADLEDAIIVALTAQSWLTDASWNAVTRDHIDVHVGEITRETVGGGEWQRILLGFDVLRHQDIG